MSIRSGTAQKVHIGESGRSRRRRAPHVANRFMKNHSRDTDAPTRSGSRQSREFKHCQRVQQGGSTGPGSSVRKLQGSSEEGSQETKGSQQLFFHVQELFVRVAARLRNTHARVTARMWKNRFAGKQTRGAYPRHLCGSVRPRTNRRKTLSALWGRSGFSSRHRNTPWR